MHKNIQYMLFLSLLFGGRALSAKIYDTLGYYKTLGVETNASEDSIKKAYRKISLRWHPDKNNGSLEAKDKFCEISSAYTVLSDPVQRAWYDATLPEESSDHGHTSTGAKRDSDQKDARTPSNKAFAMWVSHLKKSFAEKNKTKMVICGVVVTSLTLIGFLKIIQLCIQKDKTFTLGSFDMHLPPAGNATLEKRGFCSFKCPIPL